MKKLIIVFLLCMTNAYSSECILGKGTQQGAEANRRVHVATLKCDNNEKQTFMNITSDDFIEMQLRLSSKGYKFKACDTAMIDSTQQTNIFYSCTYVK
ncbi:MAG: hypothetical protein K2Q18_02950 [Bdellovibrionales bacterium]|nr:hypothetical protein [Bdellovibrionales bacterium]